MELELSHRVGFAGGLLDRGAALRNDSEAIARMRRAPNARCLVFFQGGVLRAKDANGERFIFAASEAETLIGADLWVFLGSNAQGPLFACALGRDAPPPLLRVENVEAAAERIDLLPFILQGGAAPQEANWLAQAQSLLNWHKRNRFCGCCGARTLSAAAGWRRDCPACGAQRFPRIDPVAIMLPVCGDRCVLGRQPNFPLGLYSALAGFIEGGETLEEAARRELLEEIGVPCGAVRYLASQPWPFPHSFMLGCLAEIEDRDLRVDETELEDARWFTRREAQALMNGEMKGMCAPQPLAVAHHLLVAWIKTEV